MNIAVLLGGISTERNVSISSGKAVVNALRELGHNVKPIDPALGLNGLLDDNTLMSTEFSDSPVDLSQFHPRNIIDCINSDIFDDVDAAFIVLHGAYGEDGRIQSLLELRGIPYTGSGVKASSTAIDKNASKMLFMAAGIPTPPWAMIHPADYKNYEYFDDIRKEMGNKLVIKPNDQGSTIGITIIDTGNLDDICDAVAVASKFSEEVMIEKYIEGREITVPILGEDALPVIEIVPHDGFYDFANKYTKGRTEYICPAEISEDIAEFSMVLTQSAYRVLGCKGFGRADYRLDEDGQTFILEMNTIPGFTATSLVPMAAREVGIEFSELCQRILNLALNITDKENNEEVDN